MPATLKTVLMTMLLLIAGCGNYPGVKKDAGGAVTADTASNVNRLYQRLVDSDGVIRVEVGVRKKTEVDRMLGILVGDRLIDQNTVFRSDGSRYFSLEVGESALKVLLEDPAVMEITYLKPPKVRAHRRRD